MFQVYTHKGRSTGWPICFRFIHTRVDLQGGSYVLGLCTNKNKFMGLSFLIFAKKQGKTRRLLRFRYMNSNTGGKGKGWLLCFLSLIIGVELQH